MKVIKRDKINRPNQTTATATNVLLRVIVILGVKLVRIGLNLSKLAQPCPNQFKLV